MSKIAVDVVLLPGERMMEKAVRANAELVERFGRKIVLDEKECLPHISLAMGCVDDKDIGKIGGILKEIARRRPTEELEVVGIGVTANSAGEKVSCFEVGGVKELQLLHEEIMTELEGFFSYDVTADMLYGGGRVGESSLMWIRRYREDSSFERFSPHITIGYGEIEKEQVPIKFVVSSLALCHLGNHCTCRKVLLSIRPG